MLQSLSVSECGCDRKYIFGYLSGVDANAMGNGVTKAANTLTEILRSRENEERAAQLETAIASGNLVSETTHVP